MKLTERISAMAEAQQPVMVEDRRYLHRHPHPSFEERETAEYIVQRLTEDSIEYRYPVGAHGIVARVRGEKPGPTIAFRADFDALRILEDTGLPFASENEGVMHACGHDSHTAVLLGLARAFAQNRDLICGEVVFLFQYAEETPPGGAAPMIEDGCLAGVDKIYGMHVADDLDVGVVGVHAGPYMAASDIFEVEIRGNGGHGSRPSETQDTISAACSAVMLINSIISRFVSPFDPAVISVCNFNGGKAYNVIPATVCFGGTVRTYKPAVADFIAQKIEDAVRDACSLYGADYSFRFTRGYPPVVNHAAETETVRRAVAACGKYRCEEIDPSPVGEDFAYYLQKIPGTFFRMGIRNPAENAVYPLHHNRFNVDEAAMAMAVETFLAVYLQETEQL